MTTVTETGSYLARTYDPITQTYLEVAPIVYFSGSSSIFLFVLNYIYYYHLMSAAPPVAVPCNCVHGTCSSRTCICFDGYIGIDCSSMLSFYLI